MQAISTKDSHLPAGPIHHHTLFTAVGLVCDVRLGLVLACELGIISSDTNRGAVAVPLLGLIINWITLRAFRKHSQLIVGNWIYLCSDLLVTCVVVTTLPTIFSGGLPLSLAYIIASSLLIGLISQAFWASLWSVGVTMSLALLKIHDTSLSTVVAAAMVAGIFIGILLGNRLNSQFVEISQLSAEAAFARAEERALAERLTIARDLHDSLAKSVHGIRMLAETLDSSLTSERHPDAELTRQAGKLGSFLTACVPAATTTPSARFKRKSTGGARAPASRSPPTEPSHNLHCHAQLRRCGSFNALWVRYSPILRNTLEPRQ